MHKVREAANRFKFQSNLKQIALALHHYHAAHGLSPRNRPLTAAKPPNRSEQRGTRKRHSLAARFRVSRDRETRRKNRTNFLVSRCLRKDRCLRIRMRYGCGAARKTKSVSTTRSKLPSLVNFPRTISKLSTRAALALLAVHLS